MGTTGPPKNDISVRGEHNISLRGPQKRSCPHSLLKLANNPGHRSACKEFSELNLRA